MLRLDYMAWLPPSKTEAKGVVAALGHRSGIAKVGHTHKHKKHKGDARAVRVHVPFEPPLLPPAAARHVRRLLGALLAVAGGGGQREAVKGRHEARRPGIGHAFLRRRDPRNRV